MAKNMQPIAKRCRALGLSPAVMGYSKKTSNRNPGGKMRRKKSEYSMQLTEKQKVKFIYGILEKRLRRLKARQVRSSSPSLSADSTTSYSDSVLRLHAVRQDSSLTTLTSP